MDRRKALNIIRRTIPTRVLIALAEGLEVGIKKHGHWSSDKAPEYYEGHLRIHLRDMGLGIIFDDDDGHTNGAAVAIRALQWTDHQLKEVEGQCPAAKSSILTS